MNYTQRLDPLIHAGTWYWNKHGKLQRLLPPAMDSESNWIVSNLSFRCQKWHKIFWELLSGKTMIHSHCQECYKVVLTSRTFDELLKVEIYQKNVTICKCGIDLRNYTTAIYGAYWYNRGLEQAKKCYLTIREWADDVLGKDESGKYPRVIVKRGCTEFEILGIAGDSLLWNVKEEQKDMEGWLDKHLDFDPYFNIGQTEDIRQKIRSKWMQWAHSHGDMTYIQHNGHLPLYRNVRVYHHAKT